MTNRRFHNEIGIICSRAGSSPGLINYTTGDQHIFRHIPWNIYNIYSSFHKLDVTLSYGILNVFDMFI